MSSHSSAPLKYDSSITDERHNSTWDPEGTPPRSPSEDPMDNPWTISIHRFPNQELPSVTHPLTEAGKKTMMAPNKKMKAKAAVDNNTGLRKSAADHTNRLPSNVFPDRSSTNEFSNSHKPLQERNLLDLASASSNLHTAKSIQTLRNDSGGANELLDHEYNRPGKINLPKLIELPYNSSKPAWMTNRQPSSLLYHFHGFRKGIIYFTLLH